MGFIRRLTDLKHRQNNEVADRDPQLRGGRGHGLPLSDADADADAGGDGLPQQVPTYISAPKFEEPIERSDVHHGYDEHLGRVKMQIYRGPTTGKGYEYFAPWGYYNTQPADFHKKHH